MVARDSAVREGTKRPPQSQIDSFIAPFRTGGLDSIKASAASDAGIGPDSLGEFLESTIAAAARGGRLGSDDLGACHATGQACAQEGIALAALLDLYLSALWRLWEAMICRAASAAAVVVATVGGSLFHAADDAAAALADGYQAGQRQAVRQEESARREFVDDLLSGSGVPDLLGERAARFGFNLASTHIVAVARTGRVLLDAGPVQAGVESRVLASFGGRDVMVATKDGVLVCVVPATNNDLGADLLRALSDSGEGPWQVAIGRPYGGPGGLVRSYTEARESLELARRLGLGDRQVSFEALLPYRILDLDPVTVAEMVHSVLGPLNRARGGAQAMIDTLEAYFAESSNITATARHLYLSPRAVVYRLERIAALTGHAVDQPDSRFVLELAVRGRRLARNQPDAHDRPLFRSNGKAAAT